MKPWKIVALCTATFIGGVLSFWAAIFAYMLYTPSIRAAMQQSGQESHVVAQSTAAPAPVLPSTPQPNPDSSDYTEQHYAISGWKSMGLDSAGHEEFIAYVENEDNMAIFVTASKTGNPGDEQSIDGVWAQCSQQRVKDSTMLLVSPDAPPTIISTQYMTADDLEAASIFQDNAGFTIYKHFCGKPKT